MRTILPETSVYPKAMIPVQICQYCGAPLNCGSTTCQNCGKDGKLQDNKQNIKSKSRKQAYIAVIMLAAIIIGLLLMVESIG